jgi:hypothetical protein
MDRAEDRLAHPTIRADDWPHPRSVIAGTDAFVCRDLAELRGRTPRQHPAQQLNTCWRWSSSSARGTSGRASRYSRPAGSETSRPLPRWAAAWSNVLPLLVRDDAGSGSRRDGGSRPARRPAEACVIVDIARCPLFRGFHMTNRESEISG